MLVIMKCPKESSSQLGDTKKTGVKYVCPVSLTWMIIALFEGQTITINLTDTIPGSVCQMSTIQKICQGEIHFC